MAADIFQTENLLTGRTQIDAGMGFNSDDFEVDNNNIVSLKNKTSYWSCSGVDFVASTDDSISNWEEGTGGVLDRYSAYPAEAGVHLPHGAVVTSCIVHTSGTGTWTLTRIPVGAVTTETMATAAAGTADTTITNATIDNQNYKYLIVLASDNTEVKDAMISYTTDYI